jgi:protein unc-45
MSSTDLEEKALKALSQKLSDSHFESLLPEELNLLIDSFLSSQNPSVRAQSLLFLSKFSSDIRQKYSSQSNPDVATSVLVRTFSAPVEARLADTQESATLSGLLFLAALFQVDWASACEIFCRDGLLDAVMDALDIYPSSQAISVAIASLLSQASGHKQCRSLVFGAPAKTWLEKSTSQAPNSALRAAAAVALVKLTRGLEVDAQSSDMGANTTQSSSNPSETNNTDVDDNLVDLMKKLVVSEDGRSSPTLDAVEGLAYLTVQATAKEAVSADPAFLKCLMALVPRRPSAASFPASHADRNVESLAAPNFDLGLNYGIAVIISNLCAYKPRLSDEEQQIEKLRRMTKEPGAQGKLSAKGTNIADWDKLDDDDHVRNRGKRLMIAGVVEALTGTIKNLGNGVGEKRSMAAQRTVAKAFLSLVEEKANRGPILQGGGAKALLSIISASMAELSLDMDSQEGIDKLDTADLPAIQALAKLCITSPPTAVFGPMQDSYVDGIRPFAVLLNHSSASLLQQFEAVMALTNISSLTSDAADRVSTFRFISRHSQRGDTSVGDIVKRVETHLLDSNVMFRRASTELICNLVAGSEGSFNYFGGTASSSARSRLQILVALSDVDDLPTRLAASGALATLTTFPEACKGLAKLDMERHRVLPTLVELISPEIAREYREERPEDEEVEEAASDANTGDLGLVLRGVMCVHNLFTNLNGKEERKSMCLEAEKRGLVRALVQILKSKAGGTENGAILRPTAEVLKWVVQSGVKLPL